MQYNFYTSSLTLNTDVIFSYNHVIDGLVRVVREEGFGKLYNGAQWAISRCVFVSIGQMPFYDVVKQGLLGTGYFQDNVKTHLLSSMTAVRIGLMKLISSSSAAAVVYSAGREAQMAQWEQELAQTQLTV